MILISKNVYEMNYLLWVLLAVIIHR